MKASKAYRKDRFNTMTWEWLDAETVVIRLVDDSTGKSGKFTAKVVDGKITEVLEDEDMK
jgi:hypothetical protein